MEKIKIIDKITAIFEQNIKDLQELRQEVEAEEGINEVLMQKITNIEALCTELKKGVIG